MYRKADRPTASVWVMAFAETVVNGQLGDGTPGVPRHSRRNAVLGNGVVQIASGLGLGPALHATRTVYRTPGESIAGIWRRRITDTAARGIGIPNLLSLVI